MNYKVYLSSSSKAKKLKKVSTPCIVAIEPEDFTKDEVLKLKNNGYTVLGYISIGSVSDERSYFKQLKPYCLKGLKDWEHEYYIDLRRTAVRDWCVKRAREIKALGCDGYWVDNVDVYEEYPSSAMFNAVQSTLRRIKGVGGYVMVNGGSKFFNEKMQNELSLGVYKVQCGAFSRYENAEDLMHRLKQENFNVVVKMVEVNNKMIYRVQTGAFSKFSNAYSQMCGIKSLNIDAFIRLEGGSSEEIPVSSYVDGITQEEVFTLISDYSGKGQFKSQESAQSHWYREYMSRAKTHGLDTFLLEYSNSAEMTKKIKEHVKKYGLTGYYVSSDVNL